MGCAPPFIWSQIKHIFVPTLFFVFLRGIHVQCPPPPVGSQGWVVELTGFSPGIPAQGTLYKVLGRGGRWLLGFPYFRDWVRFQIYNLVSGLALGVYALIGLVGAFS